MPNQRNVYGKPLKLCCGNTGFTREGFCYVPESDLGNHSVCAIVTQEFLDYSLARGNDLVTPNPRYHFNGLKAGDRWCLCVSRWKEALVMDCAPPLDLEATNITALKEVELETLEKFAISKVE
ncbi:DUF2237 family protein [Glaciecola sp. KUL10]|uniref:DUF2237 family protein n=1 Tax=Glaciecola sp. (strain KUL10) TaxID=2161813 RepID=UPI000D78309E|nr:DUF2237 domain-containing protein [Glaciecola sp. KUL10]GBL04984.1 hypothetical protein KUL10_23020 [Glaciecola sp. KUL10]